MYGQQPCDGSAASPREESERVRDVRGLTCGHCAEWLGVVLSSGTVWHQKWGGRANEGCKGKKLKAKLISPLLSLLKGAHGENPCLHMGRTES